MAIPALARLAPDVEHTLDVALKGDDPAKVADALATLYHIVFVDGLPSWELGRVVAVARERLQNTEAAAVWAAALDLAIATRDPQLRSLVSQVASGAVRPAFSIRLNLGLWVRGAAQRALATSPWRQ